MTFRFNNFVDECVFINLEKRKDRLEYMNNLSKKFNSHFKRIDAVSGNGTYISNSKSCYESHIKCLENNLDKEIIMIMEDDVIFKDEIIEDFEQIIYNFKQTDSSVLAFHGGKDDESSRKLIKQSYLPYGTHCYIVKNIKKYNELLKNNFEKLNKMNSRSYDIDVNFFTKIGYQHITNFIYTHQASSYSDVQNKFRNSKTSSIIKDDIII